MAKQYKGSLSLDWYNKQKAILLRSEEDTKTATDIPAPKINWVNKDDALYYEINEEEGRGIAPFWVDRNDIRVKEARPLVFQKGFIAKPIDKKGSLPGMDTEFKVEEIKHDDATIENILIKGDNLLALNTLKKIFDNKPEVEKVKCIYIDPPYNSGSAFEYYDDNFENSEWLTLMRDRLILLRELLANTGVLFVQISDKQVGYLQVLLDEVFGRNNFINKIAVRTKSPSGFQTVNLGVFETAEYILLYGKEKQQFTYIPQFTECPYDTNYNKIITDKSLAPNKWAIQNLIDYVAIKEGYTDSKAFKKEVSKQEIERLLGEYAIKNAGNVFRLTAISDSGAGKETVELKHKSKEKEGVILVQIRDGYPDRYILNGQEIAFYSKKIKNINGVDIPTVPLTNIWTDIAWEGISTEGGIEFQKSKKPERLLKRIYEMSTNENDFVLDCFGGSGTSFAVAHKLKRKWIGIELGLHSETLIVERLKTIIAGKDNSGITKDINWQGGGSFKYYSLGNSIITKKGDEGDFNWSLGKEFIQESFLSSYDYIIDSTIDFQEGELFADKKNQPLVGVQTIGTKKRVAVITLNEPKGKLETLSYEEMQSIYKTVKKKFSPEYINIFTNRGIEIAYDSKPDDLEVVKIPNAIFAELEK